MEQMKLQGTLEDHNGWATQIATTTRDDRTTVISSSRDKTMIIWDVDSSSVNETGHAGRPLKGHGHFVSDVCKFTIQEDCHTDWVSTVRFSPNVRDPVIVSAGWDKVVKVWNLGLVHVAGPSKFLEEKPCKANHLNYMIVERAMSAIEKMKIAEPKLWSRLLTESLNDSKGTHVVVGIEWGCNVIVSLDFDYLSLEESFKVKVFTDDPNPTVASPRTLSGTLRTLQEAAHHSDNGKRFPINYLLLDLKSLFKELKKPHEADASFKKLSKKQLERLTITMIDAESQFELIEQMGRLMERRLRELSKEELNEFMAYDEQCATNKLTLVKAVKDLLPQARGNNEDAREEIVEISLKEYNEWATVKGVEKFHERFANMIVALGLSEAEVGWEKFFCTLLLAEEDLEPEQSSPELEYDLGNKFYCGCGACDVTSFTFRCCNDFHGNEFLAFDEQRLKRYLSTLTPYERINILVIGKTGVGKSTWINATATYISHDTLEAAAANEFTHLIPFQFTTTNVTPEKTDIIKIKIGDDKNEVYREKMSCTQHPRAHYFKNNDQRRVYCIVDTPGVGDCQGIEKDKENMQNIVNFMGNLGEINLICFLLDPNEARLDPPFEFCFKELIMQFHRSAIHNIAFCFTKASGVGYKVSETIVPLQTLVNEIKERQRIEIVLNDKNLFVFDNIAYRYLAYLHKMEEPEKDQALLDLYARSYKVSANETKKMLDQALQTPPHRVEDTLHLNYTRRIVKELALPLTMIGTKVVETINEIKAQEKRAQENRGKESEMLKVLKVKVQFYRFKMTYVDKMVCSNCTTQVEFTGVERDKVIEADPSLATQNPVVMVSGGHAGKVDGKWTCKECGPNFPQVMVDRSFAKVYEDREEIDECVQKRLKEAIDDRERCQILIQQKSLLKDELEQEMRSIQKAAARFGVFLKENSITAYNDITEQYLLILMDLQKKQGARRGARYESLAKMLEIHKIEVAILEQHMNNNLGNLKKTSSDDVIKTAEALKQLKHYGKDIHQALEGVKQWVAKGGDLEPPSVYNPSRQKNRFLNFLPNFVTKRF
ncbi:unnamed protein product, partial [Mesorhabditis belari]|uniref:G domain-containing protein n=1 Tax=Mesorhabditis belari TaxID=2138241 RepID=A0AAF3EFL3_9BILA